MPADGSHPPPDHREPPAATEGLDPRAAELDLWPAEALAAALWEGQMAAVAAVGPALASLARAAEAAAERLGDGEGRLGYAGAGTSARVAAQDGAELEPTFDWPGNRLLYLIAGGPAALLAPVEGAEDDARGARVAVADAGLGPADVLVGVAASGRTPWTLAAVEAARAEGALTVGIASNPGTPLLRAAEHPVLLATGPELLAGSTRMKAGTAQKAALTVFSTALMVRLGRVHGGWMVEMRPRNAKLRERAAGIVAHLAGVGRAEAEAALAQAGGIKEAVLVAMGASPRAARDGLRAAGGSLRAAIAARSAGP